MAARIMHNPTMMIDCDVLVVGAGISGLTAAYALARRGARVEIVEAASRAGGVIGTAQAHGLLYERGPNSVLDAHPAIGELVDALGLAHERIAASATASRRYIVRNGTLEALPASPPAFLKTRVFSTRAKLRLLKEPFIARGHGEETVSRFVERRLGRELLDYAVEPFVAGIYAGNPDELSLAAAFPKLHALERRYGSLVKGQVLGARERARTAGTSRHVAQSFSFVRGMQTLPDALARAIGHVRTGVRAQGIRAAKGRMEIDCAGDGQTFRVSARSLVLAVPAPAACALVRDIAPAAASALEEVPYAAVATVALSYPRSQVEHPLDGFGLLAPRVERRRILGTLFSSSMFEGRAPEDAVLLTTFIGGRRNPEAAALSDEALAGAARAELADLVGARGEPRASFVTRWRAAIPQYTLGHLERIERAAGAERTLPGLFLCGAYRGGVSVGDCIRSAIETADRVAAYLRG